MFLIDTAANTVTATVTEQCAPGRCDPFAVAITPDGGFAYVANAGYQGAPGNTVSIINTASNNVVATIEVGTGPSGLAITPDGRFVYVANSGFMKGPLSDSVSVIDATKTLTDPANAVAATIHVGNGPFGIAIAPDGRFAYVSYCGSPCGSAAATAVIDTATNSMRATVQGGGPLGGAITPDGHFIYGVNPFTNTLSVIDTTKALTDPAHAVAQSIVIANCPFAVAITPDARFAYVVNRGEGCSNEGVMGGVAVVDTAMLLTDPTHAVVNTIPFPAGSDPAGIAITPDGRDAYVTAQSANTVSVIDTAALAVVTTIPIPAGDGTTGIAIAPFPCGEPPSKCVGDCNSDTQVTVDELLTMVNTALGNAEVTACEAGDANHDAQITIDEILTAVNNALNGCPGK